VLFALLTNKTKNKKYYTVGKNPKSKIEIVERCKIDTPNTKINNCLISKLGIDTSLKVARLSYFLGPKYLLLVKCTNLIIALFFC
jgi:hypothetical protein